MRNSLSVIGVLLLAGCGMPEQGEMKLHYDQPAEFFEEALPIGNGRLGAMVYGGTVVDKISLNDITLDRRAGAKGQACGYGTVSPHDPVG